MIETAKKLSERITKILTDRENAIKEVEQSIKTAEETAEVGKKDLEIATRTRDSKGYKKAKEKISSAEADLEMNRSYLSQLRDKPLIDELDYRSAFSEVKTELDNMADEAKKRVVALAEEMFKIGQEYHDAESQANEVLARWQRDIFRYADMQRDKDGNIPWLYLQRDRLKVDHPEIHQLATDAVSAPGYYNCSGKRYDKNTKKFVTNRALSF